jgi:hypothetical protein
MQTQPTLPADTPVTAFATGASKDDPMRNFGFTVAAYSVLWMVLLAFVFLGWRRQAALDARIADLEGALLKRAPRPPGDG